MPVLFPYLLERIFQFIKFNFCIQIINFSIIDPILVCQLCQVRQVYTIYVIPWLETRASLECGILIFKGFVRLFEFSDFERLVLFVQENRRSLHSSFIFILFLWHSRLFQYCTRTGRNYWPSTTSGFNFSRGVEDFFSYDRRNFHAGKYYRSLTSERLVSSMM